MDAKKQIVAELYRAAADNLEDRDHSNVPFVAGSQVWSSLHSAVHDLITAPLVQGVRRRADLEQVQHWRADKDTVIKTLRDLADDDELQLDLLRDANAEYRIAAASRILREAFGWPANDHAPLETIADWAAGRLRALEAENERLRERLAEASGRDR